MDIDREEQYQIFWTEDEQRSLSCSECSNILFPPKQLDCCGLRICGQCAKKNSKGTLVCPDQNCKTVNPKIQPDRGYEKELLRREIRCPLCPTETIYAFKDLLLHLNEVHQEKCSTCEEKFSFPRALIYHQRELCEFRSINCPLSKIGCQAKFPFKDLDKHCASAEHQMLLTNFCEFVSNRFGKESRKNQKKSLTDEDKNQLRNTLREIETVLQQLSELNNQSVQLKSEKVNYEKRIDQCRKMLTENYKLFEISGKSFGELEKTIRASEQSLTEIEEMSKSNYQLLDLNNNVVCMINLAEFLRTGEARSGRIQTSPSGYAMELRFEILRQAKPQLSVTLVFLEGEYDAILRWPFTYLITVSLINMKNSSKTISHKIEERFSSKTNNQWKNTLTIPSFCLLDKINDPKSEYREQESIFFRFHCDFYSSLKSAK